MQFQNAGLTYCGTLSVFIRSSSADATLDMVLPLDGARTQRYWDTCSQSCIIVDLQFAADTDSGMISVCLDKDFLYQHASTRLSPEDVH